MTTETVSPEAPPGTETLPGPDALTGAYVLATRTAYGLSRDAFSALAGFTGKSSARLNNIEKKDSWKDGDREGVHRALAGLLASGPPPSDRPRRSSRPAQGGERASDGRSRRSAPRPPVADHTALLDDLDLDLELLIATEGVPTNLGGPVPSALQLGELVEVPELVTETLPSSFTHRLPPVPEGARRFTNGEHQTWNRCRRKWWLAWYRRLAPAGDEDAFSARAIGTRIHRALAMYYVPDGQVRVDPRDAINRVITEDWTRLANAARAAHPDEPDEVILGPLGERFNRAVTLERAMIEGYVRWLSETGADSEYRVLGSEQPRAVELKEYDAEGELHVQLVGLLDVRLERLSDGANLLMDHKSVGSLTDKVPTLRMDPQMLHYHLIEFLTSQEAEQWCDGALYNMLRKVKHTRQANPPFFSRVEVRHSVLELNAYRARALGAVRDIMRAEERLRNGENPLSVVYPTPRDECKFDCDFFPICPMFDDGSRVEDAIKKLYVEEDPYRRYDRMAEL